MCTFYGHRIITIPASCKIFVSAILYQRNFISESLRSIWLALPWSYMYRQVIDIYESIYLVCAFQIAQGQFEPLIHTVYEF